MKTVIAVVLLVQIGIPAHAQYQTDAGEHQSGYYTNPVFAGDYPDPSILREGDDFYVVHSSFEYYPGLLIWHSKDLINWTPVTNALYTYVGSVWAPDLVKHKGRYYIYFPANQTNYVVAADAIEGPWSEPVDLKINHIDPGHVTDSEGNRYLYFSNGDYAPLSKDGLSVTGELTHSYDGWSIPRKWSIECFCMEGPKLVQRGDYYYITVAEGGTAGPPTGHMVIAARSKSPLGPWENSPHNPILRTTDKSEKWWSIGHGTVFEDTAGRWWMIFHGYENGHYNMGRQTLLAPVIWTENSWYIVPDNIEIDEPIKKPAGQPANKTFSINDTFDGDALRPHWRFFGEYDTNRFQMTGDSVVIQAKGDSVGDSAPLLAVPSHHAYEAQVELVIEGDAVGGLILFYNPSAYSGILTDRTNILANLRGWQFPTEENVIKNHVHLRLRNIDNVVDMYYSADGSEWTKIENSADVTAFHHNVLSGFLSLRLGLVSMGNGKVEFKNFAYKPL